VKVVGQPTPRIDARERVSGTATYTADVRLPGLLTARVLRSPHPHARIIRIDTKRALALPGVEAIITHDNCRVAWGSGDTRNKRFLFNNPVRFVGDAVAAVAAVDRHVAEEAVHLIDVEYERLPFVLDPERALEPSAVEIHPGGNLSPDDKGQRTPETYRRGDIEEGFRSSDRIFEDRYSSPHINNAQMEPRVSVASWDGDRLTVHASTQGISNCRDDLAADLGLRPEQVRVVCEYMGGGFGNKNQCHDFDLMAAVLAREAGAPVRMEFTRKEDFVSVHGRWPTRQYYRIGVTKDGTLKAIQLRGYSGMGGYRKGSGSIGGIDLYRCPHVETKVHPVYTNTAVAANFRAPAYPQGVFGLDSMMDHIAHELGINPLEFRLKNITREYHDELPYTSYGLEDCIRRGAEAFDWTKRWRAPGMDKGPIRRGVGMSIGSFHARVGRSSAIIRLDASGRYAVHVGVTDVGAGAKTTMALIAAEALGVPLDRITIVSGDTDRCPYSIGESGSRTTNFTGYAVIEAARDLQRQIEARGLPQGEGVLIGSATPEPRITGKARYSFAAHFVEVEVDVEFGELRVLKYLAVHDSGRIVNPLTATSQVKGGATMGLGMALHEQLLYDRGSGVPLNAGYYGARVATHLDAPVIDVMFVEPDDEYGPYGAKPVGEPPIIPSVAAVGNAFFNATGRRLKDLPFTRERILEAVS
jgi:CO/xanthine dehydrogenase Mo-binding subunit